MVAGSASTGSSDRLARSDVSHLAQFRLTDVPIYGTIVEVLKCRNVKYYKKIMKNKRLGYENNWLRCTTHLLRESR